MPSPQNRSPHNGYFTAAGQQRILEYRQQGLTLKAIAKEMGCSVSTVWSHINKLPDIPLPTVPITVGQYRLMMHFEQSDLHLKDLAAALKVDILILGRELIGAKAMSTQRIKALKALLEADAAKRKQ